MKLGFNSSCATHAVQSEPNFSQMEGRASNFERVLADVQRQLKKEHLVYVAVDLELTGVDLAQEPDGYEQTASQRLSKLCRIAEQFVPIQMGFTMVFCDPQDLAETWKCATYNFLAFPWSGPELLDGEQRFSCQASSLLFNARNGVDLGAWVREGVPYMTRLDESRYLSTREGQQDTDLPRKVGLLRLWKALCESKAPLVVHCPLDLFFLLTCFEQRQLPSEDPQALAQLVRGCFPRVFDTAHLHESLGLFQSLQLSKFHAEAKLQHEIAIKKGAAQYQCNFKLEGPTLERYGHGCKRLHEAGYDSLLTAQLFAYLMSLAYNKVKEGVNRLFLYRSAEYLDLGRAAAGDEPGVSIFDFWSTTVIVAKLERPGEKATPNQITNAGFAYKWMNPAHILILINENGEEAIKKAAQLSAHITGITEWMSLDQWREKAPATTLHCDVPKAPVCEPASSQICYDAPEQDSSSGMITSVSKEELQYTGKVKSFQTEKGFGFIECPDTQVIFNRDVFLHHSQIGDCKVNDQVLFNISTNNKGQPQARNVKLVCSSLSCNDVGQQAAFSPATQEPRASGLQVLLRGCTGPTSPQPCSTDHEFPESSEMNLPGASQLDEENWPHGQSLLGWLMNSDSTTRTSSSVEVSSKQSNSSSSASSPRQFGGCQ